MCIYICALKYINMNILKHYTQQCSGFLIATKAALVILGRPFEVDMKHRFHMTLNHILRYMIGKTYWIHFCMGSHPCITGGLAAALVFLPSS